MPPFILTIRSNYRIVSTVGPHVIAQDALPGGSIGIGIEESACCGIVISRLKIIETGLYWDSLATGSKTACFRIDFNYKNAHFFLSNYTILAPSLQHDHSEIGQWNQTIPLPLKRRLIHEYGYDTFNE